MKNKGAGRNGLFRILFIALRYHLSTTTLGNLLPETDSTGGSHGASVPAWS
jgi:hypothetical protein